MKALPRIRILIKSPEILLEDARIGRDKAHHCGSKWLEVTSIKLTDSGDYQWKNGYYNCDGYFFEPQHIEDIKVLDK